VAADSGDADAVAEICARLDGIPLAIELAASRMASMTAGEVRDRLDNRFRLLVGAKRGLERHHTLRQAVAWSYDLLHESEKSLLARCSVFAGGFDLQSACAVAGSGAVDDYTMLDRLDALVRKSLLVADRSSGRTRYSMLETIRQFAEEQLATGGATVEARDAHARHFAGRQGEILALWDSPRQRQAYTWFAIELANLRTAFRWAADHNDLDCAAAIATSAGFLGYLVENYEPIAWAEELIEPASAVDHVHLAFLYLIASQCWVSGRIDDAVRYSEVGQAVLQSCGGDLPVGHADLLGVVYMMVGRPERWAEVCRVQLSRGDDRHARARSSMALALTAAGSRGEAMAAAAGVVDDAAASGNPYALSYALLAEGFAFRETDPTRAIETLRRGIAVAHDSGTRANESFSAVVLSRLEIENGDRLSALDYITMAIRNCDDSGNVAVLTNPIAVLATLLDRVGRYEPAATLAGYGLSALSAVGVPEFNTTIEHLREVLGDERYESLARKGEAMTAHEMALYAYDQIDRLRAELEHSN
jgi:hypothetical protein